MSIDSIIEKFSWTIGLPLTSSAVIIFGSAIYGFEKWHEKNEHLIPGICAEEIDPQAAVYFCKEYGFPLLVSTLVVGLAIDVYRTIKNNSRSLSN